MFFLLHNVTLSDMLNPLRIVKMAVGFTLTFVVLSALIGGACVREPDDRRILVFAASSLTDAITELVDEYGTRTGVDVEVSFGASVSLARQIVAGAPADVFVAAGAGPVELLIDQDLVSDDGGRQVLGNELALVSSSDAISIDSFAELSSADLERLAIVDPGLGPAGLYTQQAIVSLGLWEEMLPRIVFMKDVRTALAHTVSGNVDAAIVYRTDAVTAPELDIVTLIPSELHSPIVYLGAVMAGSSDDPDSVAFLDYLLSEQARNTFRKHGFSDPPALEKSE